MGTDNRQAQAVIEQVNRVILGKQAEVTKIMLTFLAGGHILLTDIPGVGKTTLALAFSRAMNLEHKRVQFTPDVMPSDLTGFSVYHRHQERFVYQPGSVFCNLLLADEINRTSPKTQSALLEVMEERRVTVEGTTRPVPEPFLVIATQNPTGNTGTQALPESQLDRFMVKLTLGYTDFESELLMAKEIGTSSRLETVSPVMEKETLLDMQAAIHEVFINDEVYRYLLQLITATRGDPYLERGASPRATIALVKLVKATAWLDGRSFVTPADVARQFPSVIGHRVLPNLAAKAEGLSKDKIIRDLMARIKKPSVGEA